MFLLRLCKLRIFVPFERAKKRETRGVLIAAVALESQVPVKQFFLVN